MSTEIHWLVIVFIPIYYHSLKIVMGGIEISLNITALNKAVTMYRPHY